jgi:hypothetical protein
MPFGWVDAVQLTNELSTFDAPTCIFSYAAVKPMAYDQLHDLRPMRPQFSLPHILAQVDYPFLSG